MESHLDQPEVLSVFLDDILMASKVSTGLPKDLAFPGGGALMERESLGAHGGRLRPLFSLLPMVAVK